MIMKYFFTGFFLYAGIMIGSCSDEKVIPDEDNGIKGKPNVPRIHSVEMKAVQPHENDPDVIWFDNFDDEKLYLESTGGIDFGKFFGASGGSMLAGFTKGQVTGPGNRKVAFGDFPSGNAAVLNKGSKYDTIYWRIYVKHEYGWEGAPAKLSRATSIVSSNWRQAMIAHVWSGAGNSLTLDPARGVDGQTDNVITTKYNDFDNLFWLGNKPNSEFQISATRESGYWVMVESSAILNTPGQSNGMNNLWIDGRLEVERKNLNFRGSYDNHGINAVFLESYWNSGALKTQGRWMDNFVISEKPIGPVVCTPDPLIYKTPYSGPESLQAWELELATDYSGNNIVYTASVTDKKEQVKIDSQNGQFKGTLAGLSKLSPGNIYFGRVRQQDVNGEWSEWSRWHQPFAVED
jgi:hypothetical protein